MQTQTRTILVAAVTVLLDFFHTTPPRLDAQEAGAALIGVVSSPDEGKMEGVVVTARRNGAIFEVSVVSDAHGRYSFPRKRLEPGKYSMTIRATGYALVDPERVDVVSFKTVTRDLELRKTVDLSTQLSSREWAMSMPGSDDILTKLVMAPESCTYCHSLERILKSKHTAVEFVPVITRMIRYFTDGSAVPSGTGRAGVTLHEKELRDTLEKSPFWWPPRADGSGGISKIELATYLASVNVSAGRTAVPFALKTLPRPRGQATRLIVTTWDIPRKNAVAHDSEVDSNGNLWYNEENESFVGMLNPNTNEFTEYRLPPIENGIPGSRDIMVDKQNNIWLPMRLSNNRSVLYKFEPATEKLTRMEGTVGAGGFGDLQPDGSHVWLGFVRVNIKTGKADDFRTPPNLPPGQRLGAYGFAVNSKGNPYGIDFTGSRICGVNVVKNEAKCWPTLRPNVLPRRGRIDARDRFWFGQYGGDAIGMFDTRTEKMTEWKVPIKYTTPYTATVPDAKGYVYSPSNTSERLLRLDPKTGGVVEYPMPSASGNFDTKKISFDPTTTKTVLLFANTRNAQIMRVELLD